MLIKHLIIPPRQYTLPYRKSEIEYVLACMMDSPYEQSSNHLGDEHLIIYMKIGCSVEKDHREITLLN
jgi:hypothetical protein